MRFKFLNTINFLGIFMLVLLLAPTFVEAAKGGGGKGKGGRDVGETACSTFNDDPTTFEIVSDGSGNYCHGTDGQITIPSRYRHDLKKFNANDREVLVAPICHGGENGSAPYTCLTVPANGYIWQSIKGGDEYGNYTGATFDFQAMTDGELATMSLAIQIGKQQHIYFGEQGFGSDGVDITAICDTNPVWVRCTSASNDTCEEWLIFTDDPHSTNPLDRAYACMIDYKGGTTLIDSKIEADFQITVIENPGD